MASTLLVIVSVACGIAPHMWTAIHHEESLFPTTGDVTMRDGEMWVLLVTINLAPTCAIFVYLSEFHKAINDYRRVVKSLMIFIYLGANDTDKHQGALKSDYRDTMKKCDSERQSLGYPDVQAFESGSERTLEMRKLGRQRHTSKKKDELAILKVSRVAINFSTPKGIVFFRRFRAWLTTDMHNLRADIEMFVSMSLVVTIWSSIVFICGMLRINMHVETVGDISFNPLFNSLPLPIIVLSVYILWALKYYADANKYLFDYYKCILVGWKSNLHEQVSSFGGKTSAVGWFCDRNGETQELPYEDQGEDSSVIDIKKCKEELDLSIELCTLRESKQCVLGLEVTYELQKRRIVSLVTVVLSGMAKLAYFLLTDVSGREHLQSLLQ